MRIARRNPATDIPGPVSAQLGHPGRIGAAPGPHYGHAFGAPRTSAGAQLTRSTAEK